MEINNRNQLKAAILQLEQDAVLQKEMLTAQFRTTYEDLQPINIIKNQLSKLTGSDEIQNNVIGAAISLAAGLFSKKLYERGTSNVFKQLIGYAVEFGVVKIVANNSEKIKEVVANFWNNLFTSKEKSHPAD